ncbi:MAG TPA: nucleotidyltransferase domain-containing protein [Candidatus Brocadiia bacterium]|nr:nucleotidyltransferase domain-containing protein [Planctomycetota bacterium]MDO8093659.1 nucleotidyltransferase domain-containing protein [Candidatus Brocadiales bacterium]
MAYTQDEAIELAKSFLKQTSKRHLIRFAYLFGSYARGTQKEYSDIDIAVIIRKTNQTKNYYEETFEIFHEAQEYNSLLEILCFREDEFESNGGMIVAQIKKEGIKIELN